MNRLTSEAGYVAHLQKHVFASWKGKTLAIHWVISVGCLACCRHFSSWGRREKTHISQEQTPGRDRPEISEPGDACFLPSKWLFSTSWQRLSVTFQGERWMGLNPLPKRALIHVRYRVWGGNRNSRIIFKCRLDSDLSFSGCSVTHTHSDSCDNSVRPSG